MELEQLSKPQFDRFRALIYDKSGIRIDEKKVSLLSNRLRRRLKAGHFSDFGAYYRFLTSSKGAEEIEHFIDAITTNETFFFRTPDHFDWLKGTFVTNAILAERKQDKNRELRIWSAGCATGAEPYTIAICLAENQFRLRDWNLSILGTDISEEALRQARLGTFNQRAVEGVSSSQLRRYFHQIPETNNWRIRPQIQSMVDFRQHNLMEPIGPFHFDCIFIRNVLIYFDHASKQTVVDRLLHALAPDGYLVVGPSEGIYDMLSPLKKHSTFLYQKT